MTTQSDFQGLVTRIGVATDKLEVAVSVVETGSADVAEAVVEATQAATEAKAANTSAQLANTQAQQYATSANTSATTATQKALEATQTANELKALAPFNEAPQDGKTYGRNNAAWVAVEGGGGSGTVQTVNGVEPDVDGEVTLTPTDIGAATASHTHSDATDTTAGFMTPAQVTKLEGIESGATVGADWDTNVTNKPTIPTNTNELTNGANFIAEAPEDGKQYARKDKVWSEVVIPEPEPTQVKFLHPQYENGWEYNFGTSGSPDWQPVDYYPVDAFHAIAMLSFRRRGSPHAGASSGLPSTGQDGLPISWNQMFSSAGYIQYVPPGLYWFHTNSFSNTTGGAALYNKTGYITVYGSAGGVGLKRAQAIVYDTTTNIPSVYYWKSDGTWNKAT